MATITKLDQVEEALKRLATQWVDKPVINGLITAYMKSVQRIEDTYDALLKERGLETAIGAQLDVIGLIVGQLRKGEDDETYRSSIKLRIAINNSDGTEPTICTLLQQLTGADIIIFETMYPAGIRITLEGPLPKLSSAIVDDLRDILAVTITAELEYRAYIIPPFVFFGDDSGEGFADSVEDLFTFAVSGNNEEDCLGFSGDTGCLELYNPVFSLEYTGDGGYLLDSSITLI